VREPELSFLDDVQLRPQEVEVAGAYVEALTGEVDPEQVVDRYRVALNELIEAKVAGRHVEQPQAPAKLHGVDLMDALRRSIESAQRGQAARARKQTATRGKVKSVPRPTAKTTTASTHQDPPKKKSTAKKKTTAKKPAAK
jgi:DNA end-binding protein Ku